MVNDGGLWVGVFGGFMGSGEEERLGIGVFGGNGKNEGFRWGGNVV